MTRITHGAISANRGVVPQVHVALGFVGAAVGKVCVFGFCGDEGDEEGEGATSMEMSWSLIRLCHQLSQTVGECPLNIDWLSDGVLL